MFSDSMVAKIEVLKNRHFGIYSTIFYISFSGPMLEGGIADMPRGQQASPAMQWGHHIPAFQVS
ncbi:hypothetical protein PAXRUDRAFT_827048 [Paxillus rubicundulus Ve08.2h10]|uniref:Uncharacterized protein n=1 Tax=Paxillus rubicundulus Ve08.2h10 TaxID=930991 RepID=A0A0D0DYR9_9AGAM|nr:hypothetical protein PAXRUDRAFT_827048 [Paxillus rubicundulus Ve08.2h10]